MTAVTSSKIKSNFYLKACPRCKGDMRQGSDFYGTYVSCCQCGYEMSDKRDAVRLPQVRRTSPIIEESEFEESA